MKPHEVIEKVNGWLAKAGLRTDNISFEKCFEIFDKIGNEVEPDKTMIINAYSRLYESQASHRHI